MKIESSNISFSSLHLKNQYKKESFNINVDIPFTLNKKVNYQNIHHQTDSVQKIKDSISPDYKIKKLIIKMLFEKLTGKKLKEIDIDIEKDIEKIKDSVQKTNDDISEVIGNLNSMNFKVEINYNEYYKEEENLIVNSAGSIKLSDGKNINFNINLNLIHFFEENRNYTAVFTAQRRKDPIILNMSDNISFKSNIKFNFDLDGDGIEEEISQFENTGFLVLDRNGDGIVNNGLELFGARTGNGFLELSQYDEDHNGWIDENDSVFQDLKIWTQFSNNKSIVKPLSDYNIGAIYTKFILSPFDIKDINNQNIAKLQSTSVYLNNDGQVKTAHQIDMII